MVDLDWLCTSVERGRGGSGLRGSSITFGNDKESVWCSPAPRQAVAGWSSSAKFRRCEEGGRKSRSMRERWHLRGVRVFDLGYLVLCDHLPELGISAWC